MCETKIILKWDTGEKEVMSEAAWIKIESGAIVVSDILGNIKRLDNCVLEGIDFIKHEAILRKK